MKTIRWLACVLALATLALATIGLLGLRSAAPVAAGDTLVVDDDGQGSTSNCNSTAGAYRTIQAAIDAASPGDTISVCPGTYNQDEANGRDPDTGGAGGNDFNIFVGQAVTIQGVNDSGTPITDYHNVAAHVIAKRELPTFGQDAIFVQADGVTITGLEITGWSGTENNKTVEVVGDNATIKYSVLHGMDSAAALYFDDRHFDSGTNTSHLQSYHIEENLIDGGGIWPFGIRFSNGAGWSGDVSNRVIKKNTFDNNYAAIGFVGPKADPWDVYPVGDATITGNSFSRSDRQHVVAWGTYQSGLGYKNLDWQGIVQNNTFDKAAITWTGGDARAWDADPFWNVRGIYSAIQRYAVNKAQAGDTVEVLPGTYNEQVVIDKANLTLNGPNAGVDPGCSGTRPNAEATIKWSTMTAIGTASTVVIAANGATVDGFTIENTNGTQNQVSVLIGGHYVGDTHPSDGSNVRNNIISSGYNNVYVWQSSDSTIERNRVLASVETQISIRDNAGQGTRDALRNSVLNNCIDKAGVTSVGHSVAIGVTGGGAQDFSGTLIQGNTMKNSGVGTGQYRGIDANLANGTVGNPVKIYGNTITDTSEGSIRIENSNYYDVGGSSSSTGNTITGSRGAVGGYRRGIGTAETSTGLSIQYNTISGHSSTSSNDGEIVVTTSGNTILHNTLFVADSSPTGVGGIGLRLDTPSNVFGENTFQGDGQRTLQASGAPGPPPPLTVVDVTASTFKTAGGVTLDPNSQADLVKIEDRVRHHMDVPTNLVLLIFKTDTTVATALNNATTAGAIQRAVNAVPGSTVVVGPGTYNERVTVGKSVDIRGAQYGVDPTQPGARTTPANESTIDLTGLPVTNPNVLIEIADGVSNVSLAGFTLVGSPTSHYADEAIIRAWDNDIAIEDNIMNGFIGVLYKGPGQNLQVLRNRTVFNKNGLVVQPGTLNNVTVSGNKFTLGSSPGGDESAIYLTGTTQASVTGNTATGIAPNGRALYGSNLTQLTASGNTFTGNKDAVSIFGSSTFITISNNDLSNSLRFGVNIKGQDISITGNKIRNCGDSGVSVDKNVGNTERVTVSNNDLSGSALYGVKVNTALVTQIVNAENNWWGSANGPRHSSNTFNVGAQGVPVSDGADFVPWLNAAPPSGVSFAPVTTTSPVDSFASITAGANASNPGGTVNAKAGTYTETVNVSGRSDINIVGANRDTVILKPASTLSWAIPGYPQYNSRQAAVRVVGSTGINFSDMTFDFNLVKGNNVAGVFYWDSTGTLNHNVLKNMTAPDASGFYAELTSYIRAPSYTDGARAAVTFSDNIFIDTGRLGIVTHDFVQATIEGNTFTKTTDDFGYAIEMGSRSTGTISDNIISGYDTPAASDGSTSAGIYIENSFTGGLPHINKPVTISGNTLTGNQYGLWIGNEYDGYAGDIDIIVTLQGNTIQNNTDGGVYVVDEDRSASSSVTLTASGNTVSNNGATGYYFNTYGDGELHATLTGETITGQATGILVEDNASGSSSSLYDLAVHSSTIGGSTYGINNTTTALVNAENNYWGTLSWYGYDAVSGIKDRVSGNVDWEPWKDSSLTTSYSKPTTTYVDDNNAGKSEGQAGSSGGVFGYDAFAAVQDGINNVAGSTVNVAAGTYTEQVDIGKALALIGAGQASTIIKSPSVLATKFVTGANNNKPVVYIHDATGVTIQQLTVDGDGKGNANYRMQGITFYKAGGTVDHVTITRVRETPLSGAQHGGALIAYNTDGLPRTLNVSSNIISEYQKNGMALMGAGLTTTVTGNTVTGSGPTGVIAQNGIQVSDGASGTVGGNTVSNNSYTGPWDAASNVLVFSADTDVTGNSLTDGQVGLYYVEGSGTVDGNTVSATTAGVGRPDYWGIVVSDPPAASPSPYEDAAEGGPGGLMAPMTSGYGVMTVVVEDNTITGDGSADSVGLEADSGYGSEDIDLTASYNEIGNWGYGVVTYVCAVDCTDSAFLSVDVGPMNNILVNDVGVGVYNDSSAVAVNFNYIVGNASFGVESDDAANILDATNNWWGTCDGPGPVGPGSGDNVSDYVDYDPWLSGACDYDGDGLANDQESKVIGTDWQNADTDGDGCRDGREYLFMPGFSPLAPYWYDFYDVPAPTNPDPTPNGPRNRVVDIADALGVLFYAFAQEGRPPNGNGVDYDSVKGSCDMNGDTIPDKEGLCYDRSPSLAPNPPFEAGPPNGVVDISDALTVLAQFGLDCRGAP